MPDDAMLDLLRIYVSVYVRTRNQWLQSLSWNIDDFEWMGPLLNFVFLPEHVFTPHPNCQGKKSSTLALPPVALWT